MIVLAVATSGDPCSVAVTDARGLIAERTFRHRMHLSERLIDDVDLVLKDAEVTLEAVDAFAVDLGPGSFTGVRIGVTAVKTWADLLTKPVAGVHALEAAAAPFLGQHSDLVVSVIRARPGLVYAAVYDSDGSELSAPAMLTGEQLGAELKRWRIKRITVCATGWDSARELLGESLDRIRAEVALVKPHQPHASVIAHIAVKRLGAGAVVPAEDLVPLYVAPPPIGPTKR